MLIREKNATICSDIVRGPVKRLAERRVSVRCLLVPQATTPMADPELRRDDNVKTNGGNGLYRPSRVMQRIVVRLNYCFPKPPSGISTTRGRGGWSAATTSFHRQWYQCPALAQYAPMRRRAEWRRDRGHGWDWQHSDVVVRIRALARAPCCLQKRLAAESERVKATWGGRASYGPLSR